jgi:hypothetical protein
MTFLKYILLINSCNIVIILKSSLNNFLITLKKNNILYNGTSLTCGSIVLKHFIQNYNSINLNLPKNIDSVIRSAYYGGRCEIFGNNYEGEKILHFDFYAMYQSCMLERIPSGSFKYISDPLDLKLPGFYFIEIEIDDYLPVLPYKASKLFFPNGKISG